MIVNRGFTLIELLGVIALLAIIIVIAVPSFIESNRAAQANEEEDFNETIEVATKDYINSCSSFDSCLSIHSDGFEGFLSNNGTTTISVQELKDAGFLKNDLEDPEGNPVSGNVTVTNNNGKLQITYGG